jgi:hypothetical protein
MNTSGYFGNPTNNYSLFWNKYRPSVLKMMIASETEPQAYQFYNHELKALSSSTKTFSFSIKVVEARITNPTKAPVIAKELFSVLQYSGKAMELMKGCNFEFKLDSKFLFHVARITPAAKEQTAEASE